MLAAFAELSGKAVEAAIHKSMSNNEPRLLQTRHCILCSQPQMFVRLLQSKVCSLRTLLENPTVLNATESTEKLDFLVVGPSLYALSFQWRNELGLLAWLLGRGLLRALECENEINLLSSILKHPSQIF